MRKFAIIFLSISLNMCFGCPKEPSHPDGSFEYPQHMFWFRNKKNNFQLRTLIWGPGVLIVSTAGKHSTIFTYWLYGMYIHCALESHVLFTNTLRIK